MKFLLGITRQNGITFFPTLLRCNINYFCYLNIVLAIKESLQKDGTLGRFKGEIRAAVINVLNKNSETGDAPEIPPETKLINELIREYLAWNGYLYTEQVMAAGMKRFFNLLNQVKQNNFSSESYQTGDRLARDVLTTKLGVLDDAKTAKIPLLYYIVAGFQDQNEN